MKYKQKEFIKTKEKNIFNKERKDYEMQRSKWQKIRVTFV